VGLFVELDRQDFVFYSLQPLVITSISRSPALRWGALPFAVRGIPDPGVPRYAGTVILKASELGSNDGQACGMFSVGFIDDIDFSFFTGLASGYWGFFSSIAPDFIPLAVHVDCSGGMLPLSECNRDGLVTLAEHRHLTECLDGTALEGTCFCFDNNDDGQVDMRDFADLQNFFDGP